ncbi:sigma-70 family RNA polymerase sigma factor [[Clostridium] fimetarium]|uniref:RNA polymerase sigma factor, sigma-70 family n=1 Tax=[Clostridium] fimetarium TaxID=99656 RepID=A0A1I0NE32_9FIRM|nr:sigma-70 family RNA polymerase sigma factor [[Clostridium] fimetarium]SEV99558.1 RNA polymerase sigma factor, sigma-70 family [[Clostridium] fimetarium]
MSKKYISVEGTLVEVTEAVYKEYYRLARFERYQEERDLEKGTFAYENLLNGETSRGDLVADMLQKSVEEQVELNILSEALREAINILKKRDQEFIYQIYFLGKSIRMLADETGRSSSALSRQHIRIMKKLKDMMSCKYYA